MDAMFANVKRVKLQERVWSMMFDAEDQFFMEPIKVQRQSQMTDFCSLTAARKIPDELTGATPQTLAQQLIAWCKSTILPRSRRRSFVKFCLNILSCL